MFNYLKKLFECYSLVFVLIKPTNNLQVNLIGKSIFGFEKLKSILDIKNINFQISLFVLKTLTSM